MNAINAFFQILIYLILGRAILSWFVRSPYGSLSKLYTITIQLTEPIMAPCRNLLARFGIGGTIDFSPLVAIIALSVINGFIISIIRMLINI